MGESRDGMLSSPAPVTAGEKETWTSENAGRNDGHLVIYFTLIKRKIN